MKLMGKLVGLENCKREGDEVTLACPVKKCACGRSPERAPMKDDPYRNCSAANN